MLVYVGNHKRKLTSESGEKVLEDKRGVNRGIKYWNPVQATEHEESYSHILYLYKYISCCELYKCGFPSYGDHLTLPLAGIIVVSMLRPFGSGESGCGEVGFGLVLKLVGQGPIVTCLAWEAICRIASCSFTCGLLDRVVALLGKRGRRPRVVQRVFLERFSYQVIRISHW